jgi:hypothetical protein
MKKKKLICYFSQKPPTKKSKGYQPQFWHHTLFDYPEVLIVKTSAGARWKGILLSKIKNKKLNNKNLKR